MQRLAYRRFNSGLSDVDGRHSAVFSRYRFESAVDMEVLLVAVELDVDEDVDGEDTMADELGGGLIVARCPPLVVACLELCGRR